MKKTTIPIKSVTQSGGIHDSLLRSLSFKIGREEFGVNIGRAQEGSRVPEVSPKPVATVCVHSVINPRSLKG